jgi:lysophospholipase L1-like esterase/pimeloyl-ACP methyl ester carboxylesterase
MAILLALIFVSALTGFGQLAVSGSHPAGIPVKIACIGASITQGFGLKNPEQDSYPGQLQKLLAEAYRGAGEQYQVRNFGVSGATLLRKGDLSYWNTSAFQKALQNLPDIVLIDLGGNDSKLINRAHLDEYERDYHDLIRSLTRLSSHPRIILLLPLPAFLSDTNQIYDRVITSQIIPYIRQVALEENCEVLDLHALFVTRESAMPDKIHPDSAGAAIIAHRLLEELTESRDDDFNIFDQIHLPINISSFYGYRCANFMLDGRECKVVRPRRPATGHPWVWRARFWGHEPQADIALLERGFHIVYSDVAELFGNQEAISRWNSFYSILQKAGLAKKTVLEGMSRGAVYSLNWAAANPDKVSAVYVDNPVLDLKSWPGGQGKAASAKKELELFKADYGLTDDRDIQQFAGSPIDKTVQIVGGGFPILILCADADETVPPEENTLIFEQKIKALNGNITIIHKPGFKHHPHSMPDPTPIVEFIRKANKQ